MSAPRFSVIIPAYNSAATLARAIDSVLAQSYPAHEVIVVDDGSTDGTSDVAARYGDKLRYIRQDNAGVSSARNHGAQAATGSGSHSWTPMIGTTPIGCACMRSG